MNKTSILRYMGFYVVNNWCYGYKIFNAIYKAPEDWVLEPGQVLTSFVSTNRDIHCDEGINFTTLPHLKNFYIDCTLAGEYDPPKYSNMVSTPERVPKSKHNLFPLDVWRVASNVDDIVIPKPPWRATIKIRASKIILIDKTTYDDETSFFYAENYPISLHMSFGGI